MPYRSTIGNSRPITPSTNSHATTPANPLTKAFLSAVIATVLVLQTIAGFGILFGPFEAPPYMYPFLDYPMYSRTGYEGESVHRYEVYGITADSSVVPVSAEQLGLDFWLYFRGPVQATLDDDAAALRPYARIYEERTGQRLLAFRVTDAPIRIFADSLPESEPHVVNTVWLERAGQT
ncbi:MAG TPA: hypothetical protein ENO23_04055, partial [Alphaproteobacteria bacterium]|nr:hypothetical protein [Alphaproteobacteria bacterium]